MWAYTTIFVTSKIAIHAEDLIPRWPSFLLQFSREMMPTPVRPATPFKSELRPVIIYMINGEKAGNSFSAASAFRIETAIMFDRQHQRRQILVLLLRCIVYETWPLFHAEPLHQISADAEG